VDRILEALSGDLSMIPAAMRSSIAWVGDGALHDGSIGAGAAEVLRVLKPAEESPPRAASRRAPAILARGGLRPLGEETAGRSARPKRDLPAIKMIPA